MDWCSISMCGICQLQNLKITILCCASFKWYKVHDIFLFIGWDVLISPRTLDPLRFPLFDWPLNHFRVHLSPFSAHVGLIKDLEHLLIFAIWVQLIWHHQHWGLMGYSVDCSERTGEWTQSYAMAVSVQSCSFFVNMIYFCFYFLFVC